MVPDLTRTAVLLTHQLTRIILVEFLQVFHQACGESVLDGHVHLSAGLLGLGEARAG